MTKRGPKEATPSTKLIVKKVTSILGRYMEFLYGTYSPTNRQEQDRAKTGAKNDVGNEAKNSFNSYYGTKTTLRRRAQHTKEVYDAEWATVSKVERKLPDAIEKIGLVKNKSDLRDISEKQLAASNLLRPLIQSIKASFLPENIGFSNLVKPVSGSFDLTYSQIVACAIKDGENEKTVLWSELESHLNKK